ncbi:MAG: 3-oxoacyl-[acyl-carrier-protein] reductase [Chloroflexi bacterium]|nr:3-oxoacyl-[acyl-carrier-protein] reductase [Chloroflexota bacterium]
MNTKKIALITGGSRGIGEATAIRLAKLNYNIVITYNSHEDDANKVLKNIEKINPESMKIKCDVTDKDNVNEMFIKVEKEMGTVDILVNNAGVISDSLLLRMKDEQFEFTMQTNMFGTYYCTKAALPGMIKKRWGRIINVSSVVGIRGNMGQSNYSASKAAVHGFSQSLAKEVAKRGITVNVVAPGYIKTATSDVLNDKQKETVMTWIPQGRFGEPDEVAPTIAFLTTKDADYITGTIIRVDGGMAI